MWILFRILTKEILISNMTCFVERKKKKKKKKATKLSGLTLSMLCKISTDDILKYFSYFSQRICFDVSWNCLPLRQFAWNFKSCFLGKIRKNIISLLFFEFSLNVLTVKKNPKKQNKTKTYKNNSKTFYWELWELGKRERGIRNLCPVQHRLGYIR